ncbi:MAG: Do family serine endopeptidase [Candidatus Aminicenantes bacterium]|nr:Do family serine endopeptidase [Candidatus Aminicenantes bacterium]
MKKTVIIALDSFVFGLLLAGYVFVYSPDKTASQAATSSRSEAANLSSTLYAAAPEVRADLDFTKIAADVGPAVVKIESDRVQKRQSYGFPDDSPFDDFWNRFFGQPRGREQEYRSTVMGTGFFISADGFILTNNHLVENAAQVKVVTVQGDDYTAKVVGTDPRTDLALIKVAGKNFPVAVLGESAQVKVGEWVLAIGNPLGMEHTVTSGIVSAKGRQLGGGGANVPQYEDYIQTDAAINRGNSGGPLVDMKGQVIGINSNILTPSGGSVGIGFAIPSNLAKKVVDQLKTKGKVVRGKLGIVGQNIDDGIRDSLNLKSKKGAMVATVEEGGPADKAGLKQYDVVIALNGNPVENMNDLRFKIADFQPGAKVEVTFIRKGEVKTVTAKVEELDDTEERNPSQGTRTQKDIGLSLIAMNPSLARQHGYRTTQGLLISEVRNGSEAERRGLSQGQIILQVNQKPVNSIREFESILEKTPSGKSVMVLVRQESDGAFQDTIISLRVP